MQYQLAIQNLDICTDMSVRNLELSNFRIFRVNTVCYYHLDSLDCLFGYLSQPGTLRTSYTDPDGGDL